MERRLAGVVGFVSGLVEQPFRLLYAGWALVLVALVLHFLPSGVTTPLCVFAQLAGLCLSGGAVSLRLRQPWYNRAGLNGAAGFTALAALSPFAAVFATQPEWDSFRLVLYVLTAAGVFGAFLVLLPQLWRRVVVSLVIVYHFGCILVATTAVPPPNGVPPWWNMQLWTRVYHDYMQFFYLTNAYHFYSPDPGAPTLLWFRIEYQADSEGITGYQWVSTPLRENFRTRLEFQRRLGLGEGANPTYRFPAPQISDDYARKRAAAIGLRGFPPDPSLWSAPLAISQPWTQVQLESFVRHIAKRYPNPEHPELPIREIKLYRATHNMLSAADFLREDPASPLDPSLYMVYYQGAYTPDGKLIEGELANLAEDGFRYWQLPIVWIEGEQLKHYRMHEPKMKIFNERDQEGRRYERPRYLVDFVRVHAGDNKANVVQLGNKQAPYAYAP